MTTRYFTDDGQPLLRATQAAALAEIKPGTFRQWAARGQIRPAGLDDQNRHLFAADEILACKETLRAASRRPKTLAAA